MRKIESGVVLAADCFGLTWEEGEKGEKNERWWGRDREGGIRSVGSNGKDRKEFGKKREDAEAEMEVVFSVANKISLTVYTIVTAVPKLCEYILTQPDRRPFTI